MFHGLVELIKALPPEVVKSELIDFIEGYTEIENTVDTNVKELEKSIRTQQDGTFYNVFETISKYEDIAKIDGKIELFEEFEALLQSGLYLNDMLPNVENVIEAMLLDYKIRLNEALSETLKMYYGIKIDTLNELKEYL